MEITKLFRKSKINFLNQIVKKVCSTRNMRQVFKKFKIIFNNKYGVIYFFGWFANVRVL